MKRVLKSAAVLISLMPLLSSGIVEANHVDPFEVIKVLEVDDIPAIYSPRFTQEGYLDPDDEVIGLSMEGEARAYPILILNWHEIVNDVIGGEPVAVTYCPLCGSGVVFSRRVEGMELTFGVSGRLYKSNLVMVDNQTGSFWSQITGEAILGPLHGSRLSWLPSATLPWRDWKAQHPDTMVLLPPLPQCEGGRTGMGCRDYTIDPYAGYRLSTVVYSDFGAEYTDRALHPKTAVLGLDVGGVSMAYPLFLLEESPVVEDTLNRQPVLITYFNGSSQAFDPGGRRFQAADGGLMVDQEGVVWERLTGESSTGQKLRRLEALRAMWFAWAEFHPGTGILGMRPPSVLAFSMASDPVEVAVGGRVSQVLVLNNTAGFDIINLTVKVDLPPVLDYLEDSGGALTFLAGRDVADGTLTYRFDALPPGVHSLIIGARLRVEDLPGIVFRSAVTIRYEDPDGRIVTASRDGDTFLVVERRQGGPLLLLVPVALGPLMAWYVLRWRRGRGSGSAND